MSDPYYLRRRGWLCAGLLVLCVLLPLGIMVSPPVDVLRLGGEYPPAIRGDVLTIWYDVLYLRFRWGLVGALTFLMLLTLGLVRSIWRTAPSADGVERWVRRLWPVALLPGVAVARLLGDVVPAAWVTNVAYYLPVAVTAAVLTQVCCVSLSAGCSHGETGIVTDSAPRPATREWRWNAGVLLAATLLFYLWGMDLALTTGEHVGDEGHYLTQMESLYRDHDLDIKNQLTSDDPAAASSWTAAERDYQHVAPNSRDGHWYSWHPYGLPLLLAPLWSREMWCRYLAVALLAALGCLGMFRLSRRAGATRLAGAVVAAGIGASYCWATYSARILPEVPGATLLIWLCWAIRAQSDKPWRATLIAAACCAYLPPLHIRFLPLSLMGMGLFGLFGLCGHERWPAKVWRLTVFTLLCVAGYGAYFAFQQRLFGSSVFVYGTVPVSRTLFSFPMGLWATIADVKGLVPVFPLFLWLGVALLVWPVVDRSERWQALSLLTLFLVCLLTSCSNIAGIGGACVSGRYLVVVLPLLAPAGAAMLDRSSRWARGWFLFLALASALMLALMAHLLPYTGRGFTLPLRTLRSFSEWQGLLQPLASFISRPANPYARCWATTFVLVGMGVSLWLMLRPRLTWRGCLAVLSLVPLAGGFSHAIQGEYGPAVFQPGDIAAKLRGRDLDRVIVRRAAPATAGYAGWVHEDDQQSGLLTNVPPRPDSAWRYVAPADVMRAEATSDPASCGALLDGVLDTRWTAFAEVPDAPSLTLTFARPVALCGMRWMSLDGLYPQALRLEGQTRVDGPWEALVQTQWLTEEFWSGREFLPVGAQFVEDLRCAVPGDGIRRLRVTFLPASRPHPVRLSELLLMEQALAPDGEPPTLAACADAIRSNAVHQFYGPRWVTDWLARKWAYDPSLQVPALIPYTAEDWAQYDPKFPVAVRLRERAGFLVDRRDAERTRLTLRAAGLSCEDISLGSYVLLVVPKPGRDDDAARYSLFYWTEAGAVAADANRFASRRAQRLYEQALALNEPAAAEDILLQALRVCPAHEPARQALIESLTKRGKLVLADVQTRLLKELTTPEIPARIGYRNGIEFVGLALSARHVNPGDTVRITYAWRCPPSVESSRPVVFVHVEKDGHRVFQDDHPLLEDRFPDDLRKQPYAEVLAEQRDVIVPDTALPGDYTLSLGLYDPETQERLRPDTALPVRRRAVQLPVRLSVSP